MSFLRTLFKNDATAHTTEIGTVLDLITHAAGLASNPSDIDTILDVVRDITATLGSDRSLTPQQAASLFGVYMQLEQYLTTREPIRVFTKESLRQHISPQLRQQLADFEFTTQKHINNNETLGG